MRLHVMEDGVTPRLWFLSEVSRGYHRKGDNVPSVHELHPHGRCIMTTILPGFGFDKEGRITYIDKEHDAIEHQRGK